MTDYSIIEISDFIWTGDVAEFCCFFFDSLEYELLSIGSVEITRRMSTTSITKCGLSVKLLESFFHRKYHISPVIIRILSIEEILGYIYSDSSENIDHLFKSRKIDNNVLIYLLSRDFCHFFSEILDPDFVTLSEIVESIDTSRSSSVSIRDVEITRNRNEGDIFFLSIETGEHDRISQIASIMSLSADPCDEDVRRTSDLLTEKCLYNTRFTDDIIF